MPISESVHGSSSQVFVKTIVRLVNKTVAGDLRCPAYTDGHVLDLETACGQPKKFSGKSEPAIKRKQPNPSEGSKNNQLLAGYF